MNPIMASGHGKAYVRSAPRSEARAALIQFNRPYRRTRLAPRQAVMFTVDSITNYSK